MVGIGITGVELQDSATKEREFRNRICFRPQLRGWETPTLLKPLEIANIPPPYLRSETDPVSETLYSFTFFTI
jgi:hypothetical protein